MSLYDNSRWLFAATLRERISQPGRTVDPATSDLGLERLSRWRARLPFLDAEFLNHYAVVHEIDESELLQIFGEQPQLLPPDEGHTPRWVVDFLGAFEDAGANESRTKLVYPGNSDIRALLEAITPLVRHAQRNLTNHVEALLAEFPEPPISADTVLASSTSSLIDLLVPLWIKVLALELNVARVSGDLVGQSTSERFEDYCERLRDRGFVLSIAAEYPVLVRRTITLIDAWLDSTLEFVRRLCADWEDVKRLNDSKGSPGRVVDFVTGKGDRHRGGRSVVTVSADSGFRFVYKPKPSGVDQHFQELVSWLNDRGHQPRLPTLKVLDRGEYGWCEFIQPEGCQSSDAVARFYQRQGAYIALLYALEATDLHYENLIARGEDPVLVDLETLFHPRVGVDYDDLDPASAELKASVLRVGLLPHRSLSNALGEGVDLSGLGGEAGQPYPFPVARWTNVGTDELKLAEAQATTRGGNNRPQLDGVEVSVLQNTGSVVEGFEKTYRFLLDHRAALLDPDGPIARFARDKIRVVLRPTAFYSVVQQALNHPDMLRDSLDSELTLAWLCPAGMQQPHLAKTLVAEMDEVRNGDIPTFGTYPDSRQLLTNTGHRFDSYFVEAPLDAVKRRFRSLSEHDLARQSWFLKAAMTTLSMGVVQQVESPTPLRRRVSKMSTVGPLEAARDIGDRIVELAIRRDEDSVSWLGVSLSSAQRWSIAPAGVELYDGLSGIALFLGYLGLFTGDSKYDDLAAGAISTVRRRLSNRDPSTWSGGAFDGAAGIAYCLAHFAALWKDDDLLDEAASIARRVRPVLDSATFDLVSGLAGNVVCLLMLWRSTHATDLLEIAETLGDELLAAAIRTEHGIAWVGPIPASAPLTGFSHGASGVAWALTKLFEASGKRRFLDAAVQACSYERTCFSRPDQNWQDYRRSLGGGTSRGHFGRGWCHGAPGIGLARSQAIKLLDPTTTRLEIDTALNTTLREGFGANHSLCHGDFGNLVILQHINAAIESDALQRQIDQIFAHVMADGESRGWQTGIPLGVETPGLMTGLSGIGMGLLRIAFPEDTPSVLILESPTLAEE